MPGTPSRSSTAASTSRRLPGEIEHIHIRRRDIDERREEIARFAPDAAVDLAAMTASDAEAALDALDPAMKLVAVSSDRVLPRLRLGLGRDGHRRGAAARGRAAARGSLPGARGGRLRWLGIRRRRLRQARGRAALPRARGDDLPAADGLRPARLQAPRGVHPRPGARRPRADPGRPRHLPDLARLRAGAGARAAPRREGGPVGAVLNLAEREAPTVRLWSEEILRAAGHHAELVRVPEASTARGHGTYRGDPPALGGRLGRGGSGSSAGSTRTGASAPPTRCAGTSNTRPRARRRSSTSSPTTPRWRPPTPEPLRPRRAARPNPAPPGATRSGRRPRRPRPAGRATLFETQTLSIPSFAIASISARKASTSSSGFVPQMIVFSISS